MRDVATHAALGRFLHRPLAKKAGLANAVGSLSSLAKNWLDRTDLMFLFRGSMEGVHYDSYRQAIQAVSDSSAKY